MTKTLFNETMPDDQAETALSSIPAKSAKVLRDELKGFKRLTYLATVEGLIFAEISCVNYEYKVVIQEDRIERFNPTKESLIQKFQEICPKTKEIIAAFLYGKDLNDWKVAYQEFGNGIFLTFVNKDSAWRIWEDSIGVGAIKRVPVKGWENPDLWLDTGVHIW